MSASASAAVKAKKPMSAVGAKIAAGRARVVELVAKANVVSGNVTQNVVFVSDSKKLSNPWIIFVRRLQDLKVGEALSLDTDKAPAALVKAAQTLEVEIEYSLFNDSLLVRAVAGAINEDVA